MNKKPISKRTTHDRLAREAAEWDQRRRTPAQFEDAPEAVPRGDAAQAISIRMPKQLLAILKKLAEREGIGYQVLIKKWLDERVQLERERLREQVNARSERSRAPRFPLIDRAGDRGHYQPAEPCT